MTKGYMRMLENLLHLPSKLNALSFITKTMNNDDSENLIPQIIENLKKAKEDPDKIVLMGD